MSVFLFDELFWITQDTEDYTSFLAESGVTDIIVLVYGNTDTWQGFRGYTSEVQDHLAGTETQLADFAAIALGNGVRTHAAFQSCRTIINTESELLSYGDETVGGDVGEFVDISDAGWKTYINTLMTEAAAIEGVSGVVLDFIRTTQDADSDPSSTADDNVSNITSVVRDIHASAKAVNPDCVISVWSGGWVDHFWSDREFWGRKPLYWGQEGIVDIIFDGKYGAYNSVYMPLNASGMVAGDESWTPAVHNTKDRINSNVTVIVMAACYRVEPITGNSITSGTAKWQANLDLLEFEDDIAIYTGWLFTAEQGEITANIRANTGSNKLLPTQRTPSRRLLNADTIKLPQQPIINPPDGDKPIASGTFDPPDGVVGEAYLHLIGHLFTGGEVDFYTINGEPDDWQFGFNGVAGFVIGTPDTVETVSGLSITGHNQHGTATTNIADITVT